MMKRYELSNEEWERVAPLLPPQITGRKGRPPKDNRLMLNGMLWVCRSEAQWRYLPENYGPWQSVYSRFRKWAGDGTLERVFYALSTSADMENLCIDSSSVRVHQSANGGQKGAKQKP